MNRSILCAFTLVELLVVITIAVVLLALLAPALDKAIYQAELATCGGNLKGFVNGLSVYAMQHNRNYPTRMTNAPYQPHHLAQYTGTVNDLSIPLRGYISMKIFQDPLTPKIAYDGLPDGTALFGSYKLWYSWQFAGGRRSARVGSPFTWNDGGLTTNFSVLVGDYDENWQGQSLYSNHSDRAASMIPIRYDAKDTLEDAEGAQLKLATGAATAYFSLARWRDALPLDRTGLDLNFARQDNSVTRLDDLGIDDTERTEKVPNGYNNGDITRYNRLPPN